MLSELDGFLVFLILFANQKFLLFLIQLEWDGLASLISLIFLLFYFCFAWSSFFFLVLLFAPFLILLLLFSIHLILPHLLHEGRLGHILLLCHASHAAHLSATHVWVHMLLWHAISWLMHSHGDVLLILRHVLLLLRRHAPRNGHHHLVMVHVLIVVLAKLVCLIIWSGLLGASQSSLASKWYYRCHGIGFMQFWWWVWKPTVRFSVALIMHQAWLIWHSSKICWRDRAGATVTLIIKAHMWIVSHYSTLQQCDLFCC